LKFPQNLASSELQLLIIEVSTRAGEPERHDLIGAGAILFILQEPEHFKKLEWSRSWHKLVRL